MKKIIVLLFILIADTNLYAQFADKARPILDTLCSPNLYGRGYINNGVNRAAEYLQARFQDLGLNNFNNDYFQDYLFNVNTITKAECKLDGKLIPEGDKFLVEADCPSVNGRFKILPFSITNRMDAQFLYAKLSTGFSNDEALLLKNAEDRDSLNKFNTFVKEHKVKIPLLLYSSNKKLLWTVDDEESKQAALTFPDTIINGKDEIELNVQNKFITNFRSRNVIGYVPGKKKRAKDYIVISAHYDHLGMMGNAYFPGASDNASGVSMLLNLAEYFSKNRQDENVVFMLFSGEEVGLLGSRYFVENPTFDMRNIKLLINVDIMGNAEKGITVVNGEKEKKTFDQLVRINEDKKYLPEIKIRGKAANSDHYFFSEVGVPAIFIFSNGGVGYYHDVWDKPNTINLANYDNVAKLLIDLIEKL